MFDVTDVKVRDAVGLHINISWIFFADAHHMFMSNISSLWEADWSLITPHSVSVVNILAAANINWISRRQGRLTAKQPNAGMNNLNKWHDYIAIIERKVLCWKARTSLSLALLLTSLRGNKRLQSEHNSHILAGADIPIHPV